MPDLYNFGGNGGAGGYDQSGNMWGWTGMQWNPPLMSAWSKSKLRWVNVVHVTEPGTYQVSKNLWRYPFAFSHVL